MSMVDVKEWKMEKCNDVEIMLLTLVRIYQYSRNDKSSIDAKRIKILHTSEDEKLQPIEAMKCLLPEIEKCAENYPELKKIVDMMYEKEIIFCLSEIDNLKRKLHR